MFVKGQQKIAGSGRKKGKITTVKATCEEMGIDPLKILLELCSDRDKSIALSAAREVCKYVYPQLRSVQVAIDPGQTPFSQLSDQEKLDKAKLAVQLLEARVKTETKELL